MISRRGCCCKRSSSSWKKWLHRESPYDVLADRASLQQFMRDRLILNSGLHVSENRWNAGRSVHVRILYGGSSLYAFQSVWWLAALYFYPAKASRKCVTTVAFEASVVMTIAPLVSLTTCSSSSISTFRQGNCHIGGTNSTKWQVVESE